MKLNNFNSPPLFFLEYKEKLYNLLISYLRNRSISAETQNRRHSIWILCALKQINPLHHSNITALCVSFSPLLIRACVSFHVGKRSKLGHVELPHLCPRNVVCCVHKTVKPADWTFRFQVSSWQQTEVLWSNGEEFTCWGRRKDPLGGLLYWLVCTVPKHILLITCYSNHFSSYFLNPLLLSLLILLSFSFVFFSFLFSFLSSQYSSLPQFSSSSSFSYSPLMYGLEHMDLFRHQENRITEESKSCHVLGFPMFLLPVGL